MRRAVRAQVAEERGERRVAAEGDGGRRGGGLLRAEGQFFPHV